MSGVRSFFVFCIVVSAVSTPLFAGSGVHQGKIETSTIPLKYFRPPLESEARQPVLVFLGGFYPFVGLKGYQTLFEKLAEKGVTVLAPIFITDDESKWAGIIKGAATGQWIDTFGYDSESYAQDIETALNEITSDFSIQKMVLYGHSMGARVAMKLLERDKLHFEAVFLDDIPDRSAIKDATELIVDDGSMLYADKNWPAITTIFYEKDVRFAPLTQAAYWKIPSSKKQLIEIFGYRDSEGKQIDADHFSSFTNSPAEPNPWAFLLPEPWSIALFEPRLLLRGLIVDGIAEDIHGYKPRFIMDRIDEYGLLSLLPNLIYAHSATDDPQRRAARSVIYGSKRDLIEQGKYLRKVWAESGTLPKE